MYCSQHVVVTRCYLCGEEKKFLNELIATIRYWNDMSYSLNSLTGVTSGDCIEEFYRGSTRSLDDSSYAKTCCKFSFEPDFYLSSPLFRPLPLPLLHRHLQVMRLSVELSSGCSYCWRKGLNSQAPTI